MHGQQNIKTFNNFNHIKETASAKQTRLEQVSLRLIVELVSKSNVSSSREMHFKIVSNTEGDKGSVFYKWLYTVFELGIKNIYYEKVLHVFFIAWSVCIRCNIYYFHVPHMKC